MPTPPIKTIPIAKYAIKVKLFSPLQSLFDNSEPKPSHEFFLFLIMKNLKQINHNNYKTTIITHMFFHREMSKLILAKQ